MTLVQVLGVGILSALLLATLKDIGGKYVTLLIALTGVILLSWFVSRIAPAFSLIRHYLEAYELGENGTLLVKALAVGYLTQIGSETCKDLGAEGVASKLELCGRAELLLLSLPILTELLTVAFTLVSN